MALTRTTETLLIFKLLFLIGTTFAFGDPSNEALFPAQLPMDLGPLPDGLPNWSAQGCEGCHTRSHSDWAQSGHAIGWNTPRFVEGIQDVATPMCTECHRPLRQQYTVSELIHNGERRWSDTPNPNYDPTLHIEGITCVTCHVRSGAIVSATPSEAAPHPIKVDPQLGTSESCARCHELNTADSNQPIYRTYSEWQRSPQAALGIQCQDCHMQNKPEGADHSWRSLSSQALSVLLKFSSSVSVRGNAPTEVTLTMQNTGTAHNIPTGTPFKSVYVEMELLYERRANDWRTYGESFKQVLARTVETTPPYNTITDTSLAPGETRQWSWPLDLPITAPKGPWQIRVHVYKSNAQNSEAPLFEKRFPVRVR